jgi:hypothetical protein
MTVSAATDDSRNETSGASDAAGNPVTRGRLELHALRNLISGADLILETYPEMPQKNRRRT